MVIIAGSELPPDSVTAQFPGTGIEGKIVKILADSSFSYEYGSEEQLKFELKMRKNIIRSAEGLYRGRLRFRTFRRSICNENYWKRLDNGGFALKQGVKSSEAISDIFANTHKYGTECSTAIVIIFYKSVLDIYGDKLFNRVFPDITLMNWMHIDNALGVFTYREPHDYFPGDCRYFKNPDVDPLTPEWQGENAIDFGNGTYYGHGIGITSEEFIIRELNRNRIKGSHTSAYLTKTATRPDFRNLSVIYTQETVPAHAQGTDSPSTQTQGSDAPPA